MAQLDDRQVVAAVNSCLDLDKWRELPHEIHKRFACLLSHRRIGAVCFMGSSGLGLRVERDSPSIISDESDDIVTPESGPPFQVCTTSFWMECPANLYEKGEPKDCIVADKRGTKFFEKFIEEEIDDEDDIIEVPQFSSNRLYAKKMTRSEAESVAKEIGGIVLNY